MPRKNLVAAQVNGQVRRVLEANGLAGKRLVVAVSGGPDSLALLFALHFQQSRLGLTLHGAHLNHSLRGNDSDEDAAFVRETFEGLGIPHTIEKADVEAFKKANRMSIEEAAREVRYAFLARVAADQKAEAIALGHTFDDQAETVLMHLLRGSGLTGLSGMATMSTRTVGGAEIRILRPLLELSREQTAGYCDALEIHPRLDKSNLSTEYLRNQIRLELLPVLKGYNPSISDALVRLSRTASDSMAYIEEQVDAEWDAVVMRRGGALHLDRDAFGKLHPAIQSGLMRRAILEVKGDLTELQQIHIQEAMRLMAGTVGRSLDLPGGLQFNVGYETATIGGADLDDCPLPPLVGEHRLNVPGVTQLDGWTVTTRLIRPQEAGPPPGPVEQRAFLSYDTVGKTILVRPRSPGDRFQPSGMAQAKKLQDFMVDSKVPRSWRDSVPLLATPDGIAWVVGWRVADWALAREGTSTVLEITFVPRKEADL